MTVLNARTAESIKPGSARLEYSDPLLRALRLVVQPSGVKSWAIRYSFAGKKVKQTLGPYPALSLADARKAAGAAIQSVQAGIDPSAAKRAGIAPDASVAVAVALFDEKYITTLRPGSIANTRRELAIAVKAWGSRPVRSITRRDVIDLANEAGKRGATSKNTMVKMLSSFFRWCEGEDRIDASPARGVKRTKEMARERVLDDAELAAVWHAAETAGAAGALARLLILTGCRRNEIAHLQWSEVTADAIVLPKERTKTGKAHRVALTSAMRGIIDALPRHPDRAYVLNDSSKPMHVGGHAKDQIDVALAEPWRFHDLRRSMATGMARRLKIALPVIEACLNHKMKGVMAVYQRYDFADECKDAWERWSAHIEQLTKQRHG
jgi:integrase